MIDFSKERICVTGGAGGGLGRYVCRQLRLRGVSSDRLIVPRQCGYDLTCEEDIRRCIEILTLVS